MEARLVLASAGIQCEVLHQRREWLLVVSEVDATSAERELEAYLAENEFSDEDAPSQMPVHGGSVWGVSVYCFVLIAVAIADARWDLVTVGRSLAGRVMSGEIYRTITALTLHSDLGHLVGNLAFGSLFGLLAGRVLGGGVAWSSIVAAGAIGNLANAAMRPPEHSSIGASTAVFAALGILVAHALKNFKHTRARRFRAAGPLIGGVCLFAYTGMGGENTDVNAHACGFVAGIALGFLVSWMPNRWLGDRNLQLTLGGAVIAIVMIAWTIGFRS